MTKFHKTYSPPWWVPTLYFSEGLPFIATATVSVLMYKSFGIEDARIAFFTSIIMWPWTLKPLWSPLLEMFKTKKHFVIATQIMGGVIFGLIALSLPLDGYFKYSLALFTIMAFNSATHDIAADGVYVNTLDAATQAKYIGWQGAFYNIAKVLSQGGLVYLAGRLEMIYGVIHAWMVVMGFFGLLLFMMAVYHTKILPSGGSAETVRDVHEAFRKFRDVLISFFRKKYILWGIAFVILFRSAEGQLVKIVPLFLKSSRELGGLGLSTADIGLVYGIFGAAAFVLGSLAGGYVVARYSLKRSILLLAFLFNIPDAVYAFLAFSLPVSKVIISCAIVMEWFGYGFGFVGVMLFIMQQMAPGKYKMAHFAMGTALMNIGFLLPSSISGFISEYLGYKYFFVWVMIATLPSFYVAWRVPFKDQDH